MIFSRGYVILKLEPMVQKERIPTEDEKRSRRKLSELSLIDDYLFGLFVQEAGSEEILKGLVECMLDIKISRLSIKQKQHDISNEPDLHGIRLDAFVQDDLNTLYNIEVQAVNTNNLPKRMRYYQSLMDREQMPSGEYDYDKLPKTIIIFVADFDLFGKGLYRYTFENICTENNAVRLGDESIKVVLNTKGISAAGVKPELIELLEYFHSSTKETANKVSSDLVKKLDKMLEPIKNSPKFGGDYMSYQEKIYNERKEAWQEGYQIGEESGEKRGIDKGIQLGRQEGIQEGIQLGEERGEKRGEAKERARIKEMLRQNGMSEKEIRALFPV